ncbi:helix-turn-helix domain-containing protein [Sphingobacterium lumbrici]|uniref:helix-turn-helix domain-containing protein n=1 Tax=Sphingobacterium lumbrici TaxID=2559600 RepID=UPI00112BCFE6|nr:helix-turn-helix domain-containing protein [Sphingobacterium lumbrici]
MKKTYFIELDHIFGCPLGPALTAPLSPSIIFSDGDILYRKQGSRSCIKQRFKGWYGYLQHYDIVLDEAVDIPIEVKQRDVHVFYLMQNRGHIELRDDAGKCLFHLDAQRAIYIYLVPGTYWFKVSDGRHRLFSFYFDTGIFRYGADETFKFLQPPLRAHFENCPYPVASIDFPVDPVTATYIYHLCRNLQKGSMDHAVFISEHLRQLHHFSKDSVLREQGPDNYNQYLATSAKKIIEIDTEDFGIVLKLAEVADKLAISLKHLSAIFKEECGITLNAFKKQCVMEKAKGLLQEGKTARETALYCGFENRSAFHRFFKRETGITPLTHMNLINNQNNRLQPSFSEKR